MQSGLSFGAYNFGLSFGAYKIQSGLSFGHIKFLHITFIYFSLIKQTKILLIKQYNNRTRFPIFQEFKNLPLKVLSLKLQECGLMLFLSFFSLFLFFANKKRRGGGGWVCCCVRVTRRYLNLCPPPSML